MKRLYFLTAVLWFEIIINCCGAGNITNDPNLLHKAEEMIAQQRPLGFVENKGQLMNTDYAPIPFVLFKTSGPGMDVYITEKGLTYVFVKMEAGEKENVGNRHGSTKLTSKLALGKEEQEMYEKKATTKMSWINMYLKGATIKKENITKEGESVERFNYFYSHCPQGIYNVNQYEKIIIKNVYPGIDWVFYNSSKSGMKYDFVVHPGANSSQIKLIYESEKSLKIDEEGNINIKTPLGTLTENAPYSYIQETNTELKSKFTKMVIDKHTVEIAFNILFPFRENQERTSTIIIDPQLVWATFYGASALDGPMSVDCDINGNVYVTGYTGSSNFPTKAWGGTALFYTFSGGTQNDVFILRFTNAGVLTWATCYGSSGNTTYGQGWEMGTFIKTDGAGNVYITGVTASTNFPTQAWVGAYNQLLPGGGWDAFILRFDNAGIRTWATYYGGSGADYGNSIAIDISGNVYLTGYTRSPTGSFPIFLLAGAYNQSIIGGSNDAFILRFNNTGACIWATYYGGSGDDQAFSIDTDLSGNLYVTGQTTGNFPIASWSGAYNNGIYGGGANDFFILRFDNVGVRTWATYYGGNGSVSTGNCIKTDVFANIYVTGIANNLPTQFWAGAYNQPVIGGGGWDAFILRFTSTGVLTWATYFGGSGAESEYVSFDYIEIDACGNLYITLTTSSPNMPIMGSPTCVQYYDATLASVDMFIAKFNNAGAILWATYFGIGKEARPAIALDNTGNLFVTGEWGFFTAVVNSALYPLTNPGNGAYYDNTWNGQDDGFIAKFVPIVPAFVQTQVNSTSCSPCNGSATINLTCSDPNYNYTWSNGSVTLNSFSATNTISGLCPGTYTVTATSNCNQTQIVTFVITGNACGCTLTAEFTKGTAACTSCGCKQWVMVNATGGTGPYTYIWPAFAGYDKRYKNQLCPGTYTINIKDKNGCIVNVSLNTP